MLLVRFGDPSSSFRGLILVGCQLSDFCGPSFGFWIIGHRLVGGFKGFCGETLREHVYSYIGRAKMLCRASAFSVAVFLFVCFVI